MRKYIVAPDIDACQPQVSNEANSCPSNGTGLTRADVACSVTLLVRMAKGAAEPNTTSCSPSAVECSTIPNVHSARHSTAVHSTQSTVKLATIWSITYRLGRQQGCQSMEQPPDSHKSTARRLCYSHAAKCSVSSIDPMNSYETPTCTRFTSRIEGCSTLKSIPLTVSQLHLH